LKYCVCVDGSASHSWQSFVDGGKSVLNMTFLIFGGQPEIYLSCKENRPISRR